MMMPALSRQESKILNDNCSLNIPPQISASDSIREPLRFRFKGYSLWIELEQFPLEIKSKEDDTAFTVSDLDYIISVAALEQGLQPLPSPHVTLLYGMCQFHNKEEVMAVFNGKLRDTLESMKRENDSSDYIGSLKAHDGYSGVTYDGVDGEEMDMAWSEITFAKCLEFDEIVKLVHQIFYGEDDKQKDIQQKWNPHLSLVYDNPEDTVLTQSAVADMISRFPTLMKQRKVKALSLWDTNGRMSDWKYLDRISFHDN